MYTFLVVLHIMVCLVLVVVVLLQRGKGGDVGAALGGGGSNTVFGSRGAGNFLTKLTTGSAVVFMLTSLTLAYLGNQSSKPLDLSDDVIEVETKPEPESTAPSAEGAKEKEAKPSANTLEEIPMPDSEPAPAKPE